MNEQSLSSLLGRREVKLLVGELALDLSCSGSPRFVVRSFNRLVVLEVRKLRVLHGEGEGDEGCANVLFVRAVAVAPVDILAALLDTLPDPDERATDAVMRLMASAPV